jgi:hypothetical protein
MTTPFEFIAFMSRILDRLGIPHHVGGSAAGAVHGVPRMTADVDIVIDADSARLRALRDELSPEFYVSESAMNEALATRGTFNAIHVETSFKIDFFLVGLSAFDQEEHRRRAPRRLGDLEVPVKSAEDLILRKLSWFRAGGEVSSQQWQDVLGLLAANRGALDETHLDQWAMELGLTDLLARARSESPER